MRTLDASTGWIVLAVFSVAWVFLGWLWGRRANSFDDRMLAGRNVGLALGMATAMATWITSNTTMAAPQLADQLGVWGMVGYSLGAVGLILFAPMWLGNRVGARHFGRVPPHIWQVMVALVLGVAAVSAVVRLI